MQLSEIKTRGWWAIEDDATDPNEITDAEMATLINQAVADLAEVLNLNKSATITLTANVGTLPTDFLKPIRVETSTGTYIDQIDDINDKDSYPTCWMINSATSMTVYPVATAVASVVMYYKACPVTLTNATDVPSDIPAEFHHYIADIWVKAHYYLRKSNEKKYNALMLIWDDIRNQVAYACYNRRTATMVHTVKDVWGGF